MNRLTAILLDIFEDQLDIGRLIIMQDAADLLDRQLRQLGRAVLHGGGNIAAKQAKIKAEAEYAVFDRQRKLARYQQADAAIAELAGQARTLPKRRKL